MGTDERFSFDTIEPEYRGAYSEHIYEIVNLSTQRRYIGCTSTLQVRYWAHLGDLKAGRHICKEMQRDWGEGHSFSFRLLEVDVLGHRGHERERAWIWMFRTAAGGAYNYSPYVPDAFALALNVTPEQLAEIGGSQAFKTLRRSRKARRG